MLQAAATDLSVPLASLATDNGYVVNGAERVRKIYRETSATIFCFKLITVLFVSPLIRRSIRPGLQTTTSKRKGMFWKYPITLQISINACITQK